MALAVALAAASGVAGALVLDVRGRALQALAALIVAAASIVGPALALSLVDRLQQWPWLACQLAIAVALVIAARRLGRTPPSPRIRGLRAAARSHPAVAAIVVIAAAGMAVQFLVAILVTPQNWDGMHYHLAKAAYWLQYDSATQFPDGAWRQLYTPPNAEILQAWTLEMLGTDRVVQLVQWVAGVATALAVYGGAREIGAPRPHATFAGALFLTLPQPLLQSATSQNDLVAAAFLTAAALFLVGGLRDGHTGELVVAGLATGLAVGTKGTVFFLAPGVAIVLGAVLLRARPPGRTVATAAVSLVAGVAVLGAFNWALSLKNTGSPAPEVVSDATLRPGTEHGGGGVVGSIVANAGLILWQFADSPGASLTALDRVIARPVRETFGERYPRPDMPVKIEDVINEDRSGYGLVGFLVLFPVLLLAAFGRRADPRRRLLAVAGLVSLAGILLVVAANPFAMRTVLPWVAFVAPLLAILAARTWTRALAVGLAAVTVVPVVLAHQYRPLVPAEGESILAKGRIAQQDLSRWPYGTAAARLSDEIGPRAPIGFVGAGDAWDYVFFGPRLERRVTRLPPDRATPETVAERRLAGIVFAGGRPRRAGFRTRQLAEGVWLARLP